MKILLLEDEYTLRKSIKEVLEDSNYQVTDFADGKEALQHIYKNKYDLLILDVNVPGINGFELLEHIRDVDIEVPTIFLTSLTQIDHMERGYESGCCDYIKKPFDMAELKLRVASAIKIGTLNTHASQINLPHGYIYDSKSFTLKKDDEVVQLSKTEKIILELFISNKNQVVTSDMLQNYVWDDYVDPANIRVQINNLRKKLHKDLIVNVRGLGYKLID